MSVRLFVGNLAFGVTEQEVKELFAAAGEVTQVRLPTDRETGKPRGFAFVDFAERAQAEEATRRFDQYMFKDRALAVNEARAREASPGGASPTPRGAFRPSGPPSGPRPSTWTPPAPQDDDTELTDRPRRKFGPDAFRDKRKQKGVASKEERGPKGPLRERSSGQVFLGAGFDDDAEDQGMDDFALWAREDKDNPDKE